MKQLVFTLSYLLAIGGWFDHSGFFATTFFLLLYIANFALSEHGGWLEDFLFNKLLLWVTGIGGIIGFFLNFSKWAMRIIAFVLYFVSQKDLVEVLSGTDCILGWAWIIWGGLSIWSLLKKLKSA